MRGLARVGLPSARRTFVTYAAVTAVPVVALGVLLTTMVSRQANADGLAQGRTQAQQLAQTAVAPLLSGRDLNDGLTAAERVSLDRLVKSADSGRVILRLRLRALDGKVVYSDDGSGLGAAPADDEVDEAAEGHVVASITRLNSDPNDHGPLGPRVVEVYEPLQAAGTGQRIGVLELYIPYDPIAASISRSRRELTVALGVGLVLLWTALLLVAVSVTRRLRKAGRRNAYLASHDTLTGLPNRLAFAERMQQAIDTATPERPTAVALLDLDRFKEINDTLGHSNGDALLVRVAQRLRSQVREGDTVARLGGDEFGLVLRDIHGPSEAVEVLCRLRGMLTEVVQLAGLPISVEASMGFALAPTDGRDVETLQQQADLAMYAAKRGHLGVLHYRHEHDQYDATTLSLIAAMRGAIDRDELVLHYQPKSNPRTRAVKGLEALVRWNHPERGLLYPDVFLPAIEQTELIDPLTRWVLRTAATALQRIDPSGQLTMAVNISARSLVRTGFAKEALSVIRETGTAAERMILEITETALLTDPHKAAENLRTLADAGVGISVDDFGAGQTSLGYLATLPISELKVDKGFVLSMTADGRNAAIVRSVIDLGHSLGLGVTAEGVETTQALEALVAANCDTVQGFLLSRPVPEEELTARLRSAAFDLVG